MQLGRYTLDEIIGEGGFGQVWRATLSGEMGFSKTVAIKVLHPEVAATTQRIESLVNEALIGARLKHPNIVEVHEFTRIDDRLVMVMEMVEGETLDDLMGRHPNGLKPKRARHIFTQIARGLAYAHDLKNEDGQSFELVHRDLKPANVMLTSDGTVKICDFGIALSSLTVRHTGTGMMKGTPNYMSPEQVRGLPITSNTDMWALGAIGFEMLTGHRLVAGKDPRSLVLQIPALVPEAAAAEVESKETDMAKMIGACLRQEGHRRPNATDLISILEGGSSDVITIDSIAAPADVGQTSAFSYDASVAEPGIEPEAMQSEPPSQSPPDGTTAGKGMSRRAWIGLIGAVLWSLLFTAYGWIEDQDFGTMTVNVDEAGDIHITNKEVDLQVTVENEGAVPNRYGGTLRLGMPSRVNDRFDIFTGIQDVAQVPILDMILDPLMKSQDGEIIPHALERFDMSGDGLSITLELRDDLRFHPHPCLSTTTSTPVEAKDLKWSIEQVVNRGRFRLVLAQSDDNPSIQITGERTVTVHLADPTVYASQAFTDVAIIPAAIEGCDPPEAMKQPVSTGPFWLESVSETGRAELVRFADYWEHDDAGATLPYLDRVQVIPFGTISEVLSDVRKDNLHIAGTDRAALSNFLVDVDAFRPSLKESYAHERVRLGTLKSNSQELTAYLGFYDASGIDGILANRDLRRAIALAMDRKSIADAIPGTDPYGRYLLKDDLGYEPSRVGFEYDIEGAHAALAAAGHPKGKGLEKLIIGTIDIFTEAAKRTVQSLNNAGIAARFEIVGMAQIREVWESGTVHGVIGGAYLDRYADESVGFIRVGPPLDLVGKNRELKMQIPRTLDRSARGKLFAQLEQNMIDDVEPFIPIGIFSNDMMPGIQVYSPSVQNAFDPVTGKLVVGFKLIYLEPQQ